MGRLYESRGRFDTNSRYWSLYKDILDNFRIHYEKGYRKLGFSVRFLRERGLDGPQMRALVVQALNSGENAGGLTERDKDGNSLLTVAVDDSGELRIGGRAELSLRHEFIHFIQSVKSKNRHGWLGELNRTSEGIRCIMDVDPKVADAILDVLYFADKRELAAFRATSDKRELETIVKNLGVMRKRIMDKVKSETFDTALSVTDGENPRFRSVVTGLLLLSLRPIDNSGRLAEVMRKGLSNDVRDSLLSYRKIEILARTPISIFPKEMLASRDARTLRMAFGEELLSEVGGSKRYRPMSVLRPALARFLTRERFEDCRKAVIVNLGKAFDTLVAKYSKSLTAVSEGAVTAEGEGLNEAQGRFDKNSKYWELCETIFRIVYERAKDGIFKTTFTEKFMESFGLKMRLARPLVVEFVDELGGDSCGRFMAPTVYDNDNHEIALLKSEMPDLEGMRRIFRHEFIHFIQSSLKNYNRDYFINLCDDIFGFYSGYSSRESGNGYVFWTLERWVLYLLRRLEVEAYKATGDVLRIEINIDSIRRATRLLLSHLKGEVEEKEDLFCLNWNRRYKHNGFAYIFPVLVLMALRPIDESGELMALCKKGAPEIAQKFNRVTLTGKTPFTFLSKDKVTSTEIMGLRKAWGRELTQWVSSIVNGTEYDHFAIIKPALEKFFKTKKRRREYMKDICKNFEAVVDNVIKRYYKAHYAAKNS